MIQKTTLIIFFFLGLSVLTFAHSGRTSSTGCHNQQASNTRHCHTNMQMSNQIIRASLTDQIRVIDGDSFTFKHIKIRLHGIDAPEIEQTCQVNSKTYACGQEAKIFLQSLLSEQTKCNVKRKDRYQRILAICFTGEQDINAKMVQAGHAIAYRRYSQDYIPQQEYAKKHGAGMWRGQFTMPEQFRKPGVSKVFE